MKFISNADLILFFANEYSIPGNKILFIGIIPEIIKVKEIFNFINSELIIIDSIPGINVDITYSSNNELPFENNSFDLIIDFKGNNQELKRILKTNGKILIHGMDNKSLETYFVGNELFSVI